jgi:hypothetical protein
MPPDPTLFRNVNILPTTQPDYLSLLFSIIMKITLSHASIFLEHHCLFVHAVSGNLQMTSKHAVAYYEDFTLSTSKLQISTSSNLSKDNLSQMTRPLQSMSETEQR